MSNAKKIISMLNVNYCDYIEVINLIKIILENNSCGFIDESSYATDLITKLREDLSGCIPTIYVEYGKEDCKKDSKSFSWVPYLKCHDELVNLCSIKDMFFDVITSEDTLETIYAQYDVFLECITDPGGNDISLSDSLYVLASLEDFLKNIIKFRNKMIMFMTKIC